MDVAKHNSEAWDRVADSGKSRYTKCVTPEQVAEARKGNWELDVSPRKTIPKSWLPDPKGLEVLCLAGGGAR